MHAPLSPTTSTSSSSSITMNSRKFALAQVHSDVCLVQGVLCYARLLLSTTPPDPSFFVLLFSSPLHFLHLHLYATIGIQCAPPSHTKAATPRSPRSKPKSTRTSSSPSSGTRIRPCYIRRTFGYSSGSTNRACWTRPTREPFFSLGMSWSACAGSRTGDGPSAQTQGNRRGSHVPAGEDGCHDPSVSSLGLGHQCSVSCWLYLYFTAGNLKSRLVS